VARRPVRYLAAIAWLLLVAPIWAQEPDVIQSQIVTADTALIFASTSVGQQITTELEDKVAALAIENRRIASELEAEELELTELRKTMEPAEFRVLAEAFDQKVQRIRLEQDNKQRELQQLRDAERQSFIDAIVPLLFSIARERGALVVLERRNVLVSPDQIDITQQVIDRIDEALAASPPDGSGDAGTSE